MDKKDHRTRNLIVGIVAIVVVLFFVLIGLYRLAPKSTKSPEPVVQAVSKVAQATPVADQKQHKYTVDGVGYDKLDDPGNDAYRRIFNGVLESYGNTSKDVLWGIVETLKLQAFANMLSECHSAKVYFLNSIRTIRRRHQFDGHTSIKSLLDANSSMVDEIRKASALNGGNGLANTLFVGSCFAYLEIGGYKGNANTFFQSQDFDPQANYLHLLSVDGNGIFGFQARIKASSIFTKGIHFNSYTPEKGVILVY